MKEIYVSTDLETEGLIPGPHSMLSLGSAAYLPDKTLVGTFSVNLELLPGASGDPKTLDWWRTQPEAWESCRRDPRPPEAVMRKYVSWINDLDYKPVFVSYPVAFDFMFVYWYMIRFTGESTFSHSALNIKTYAMARLRTEYRKSTKRNMPQRWFDNLPYTHRALDDAIEHRALFCNMLVENIEV